MHCTGETSTQARSFTSMQASVMMAIPDTSQITAWLWQCGWQDARPVVTERAYVPTPEPANATPRPLAGAADAPLRPSPKCAAGTPREHARVQARGRSRSVSQNEESAFG